MWYVEFQQSFRSTSVYQRSVYFWFVYLIGVTLNASVFRIHKMVEILVLTTMIVSHCKARDTFSQYVITIEMYGLPFFPVPSLHREYYCTLKLTDESQFFLIRWSLFVKEETLFNTSTNTSTVKFKSFTFTLKK